MVRNNDLLKSKYYWTNHYIFVGNARYDFIDSYWFKRGADNTAEGLRKQGYNARILPRKAKNGNTYYAVYARKRKK